VLAALRPEAIAEPEELFLVNAVQHRDGRSLDDLVFERRDVACIMHLMQVGLGIMEEDGLSGQPIPEVFDPMRHRS
jgi:hypothetical protein